jgi:hypothetical protein
MNVQEVQDAVMALEERTRKKSIPIPNQRKCTGCQGPTKGHGSAPPVGPDCRRRYSESERLEHLFDRMEILKGVLSDAVSVHSSLSSIGGPENEFDGDASLHGDAGISLRAAGNVSFESTSSKKSHHEEMSSAMAELANLKQEKRRLETENSLVRRKIQDKERRLAEGAQLSKVKSLINQERASLNESALENKLLHEDLNGNNRKSVPQNDAKSDSVLVSQLQEQLKDLSSKMDVVMQAHISTASTPKVTADAKFRKPGNFKKEEKGNLKSGAFDRWEDNIVRKEKFPHKFIGSYVNPYDSSGKEWDVNNIPLTLFVAGFAKILQTDLDFAEDVDMDRETLLRHISTVRDKKLLFLADLMFMAELAGADGWDGVRKYANRHLRDIESSAEFTWDSYKSNKDMLFMMEQSSTKARPAPHFPGKKFGGKGKGSEGASSKSTFTERKSYTCKRWNNGTCSLSSDHVTNEIFWRHQCDVCLKRGIIASHKSSDTACPNK